MPEHSTTVRDVAALAVARAGRVEETGDPLLPFRLLDGQGAEVAAVTRVPASHARRRRQPGIAAVVRL